jgi:AcrR family transcriptional regulator
MENDSREVLADDAVGTKILNSAIEIINCDGYENLTIRRVAKESGCSNSAIYQRFGDKDALAMAIARRQAEPFLSVMKETYSPKLNLLDNVNNITTKLIEIIFSYGIEETFLQVLYQGQLDIKNNPFVDAIEGFIVTSMAHGEIKVADTKGTALIIVASFWGLAQMLRVNKDVDADKAAEIVRRQNAMTYNSLRTSQGTDILWDMLRDRGVDVDKALERMKGNKEVYKSFLIEFFEDADFENLGVEIDAGNPKSAFEYAHGLKGMAANLGLEEVHNKLSILVEILRPGGLEGARKAYDDVMESCKLITVLL